MRRMLCMIPPEHKRGFADIDPRFGKMPNDDNPNKDGRNITMEGDGVPPAPDDLLSQDGVFDLLAATPLHLLVLICCSRFYPSNLVH